MKAFFNVLYRRILYKIPLKWLLIFIALFAICFANYSSALTLNNSEFPGQFEYQQVSNFYGSRNIKQYYNYTQDGISCIFISNSNRCTLYDGTTTYNLNEWVAYCTDSNTIVLNCSNTVELYYYLFLGNNFLKQWYPDMTSLQCQTNYSLIPISSVDQNYCTTNNLCPSCPECETCESFTGTISNVYINGINHLGAPNIVMNIAEEIDWDYAYTTGGQNMNIDVVGYNVDYEKMQSVIDLQNYKPTDEDFSSLISMLAPYTKIIIFFVFLFLIWAWIKKPFRSKKL